MVSEGIVCLLKPAPWAKRPRKSSRCVQRRFPSDHLLESGCSAKAWIQAAPRGDKVPWKQTTRENSVESRGCAWTRCTPTWTPKEIQGRAWPQMATGTIRYKGRDTDQYEFLQAGIQSKCSEIVRPSFAVFLVCLPIEKWQRGRASRHSPLCVHKTILLPASYCIVLYIIDVRIVTGIVVLETVVVNG